jgi:AFG3 family protein
MNDQTTIATQSSGIKKRKPRYWIWILVGFISFILIISWINRAGPVIEIQQSRFRAMITQDVIKKIVLVENEMIVEVTLKPASLNNLGYMMELERANSPFGIDPNGPHYNMRIASVDKFYRDYEKATETIPLEHRVDVQVEVRNDVTGMLINWLFLGLIIFGIVMLIRFFTSR